MEPAEHRPSLSPSAAGVLERARLLALFLHATELGLEHLFCALLDDEDNAACQALLARFADPGSLAHEARATANGILVVASHTALPFSTLGVRALCTANAAAARRGEALVTPARIALACLEHAPAPFTASIVGLGLSSQALEQALPPAGAAIESNADESLFRRFGIEAKKQLAVAARSAQAAGESSISPQQLLIAALTATEELKASCGETAAKARGLQAELLADPTPAPERNLGHEPALREYLARLPAKADTLDMLLTFFQPPQSLVAQILTRQGLRQADLEAARGSFGDPAER